MNEFLSDIDLDFAGVSGALKRIQPPGPIRRLFQRIDNTNDFVMDIDWSTFSGYMECAQKAEYSMIYSRNDGGSIALTYGRAIHKGLEEIYLARARGHLEVDWSAVVSHINTEYSGLPFEADWRTPERALDTLLKYDTFYANEPYSIMADEHGDPFVEKPFSYTLCAIPVNKTLLHKTSQLVKSEEDNDEPLHVGTIYVNWTGVIDLVFMSKDDHLWPVDHKTTSIAGPAYYKSFALSGQFIGYCAAIQHLLHQKPAGMLGNFIVGRKASVKGKGVSHALERELYTYEQWQLDKWRYDTVNHAEKFVHDLSDNYFPANHTSCQNKYGLCKYFATCQAEPSDRLQHLMSDAYVFNVWNPLAD